jgi:hypothetical protein
VRVTKTKHERQPPREKTDPRSRSRGNSGKAAVDRNNPTRACHGTRSTHRNTPAIRPKFGRTDFAKLERLIAKAKSQLDHLSRAECYATAEHRDLGETLKEIRSLCTRKGEWERALRKLGLARQRAWEYIQYTKAFATREDAAACPIGEANDLIKKTRKAEDEIRKGRGEPIVLPIGGDDGDHLPTTNNQNFCPKNRKTKATLPRVRTNSDELYTPEYAVSPLLPYLPKNKVIWECAWGTGELADHLRKAGYRVVGNAKMDFLQEQPHRWDIIVTNPPFSYKTEFLERAYSLGKPFAFLLPLEALVGKRARLYRQHGIQVLIPDKRINFYDAGGQPNKANFPTAWFCWKLLPAQLVFVEANW